MVIRDASSYVPNIPAVNPVLEITSPGGEYPVVITDIEVGFSKVVDINTLHINASGPASNPDAALPDGIYKIRYSVAPNSKVFISYLYFRNVKQLNLYMTLLTDILKNRSSYSFKEYMEAQRKFLWYKELIDGAKYLCEDRFDSKSAQEIYDEVNLLLNNFSC